MKAYRYILSYWKMYWLMWKIKNPKIPSRRIVLPYFKILQTINPRCVIVNILCIMQLICYTVVAHGGCKGSSAPNNKKVYSYENVTYYMIIKINDIYI